MYLKWGDAKLRLVFDNGELRELASTEPCPLVTPTKDKLRWEDGTVLTLEEAYMQSTYLLPRRYICSVIDAVQHTYLQVSNQWQRSHITPWNLRKLYVRDVYGNTDFYDYVRTYLEFLHTHVENNFNAIVCRVKTCNSVEYKLVQYMKESHQYGKIPVNKCLNDLMGFRVIVEPPTTYEQIKACSGIHRCTDSSKGTYKATHLYLSMGNQLFPWELQVWNLCDRNINLLSHKQYKQNYVDWERG